MGWIYLIESPSGKAYIGQTTVADPATRLKQHLRPSSRCYGLKRALEKYGGAWENGTIKNFAVSFYFCPDEELDAHEELMIESLGTLAPDGYNLKGGGKSGRHSAETKRKISEGNKGKTMPEEARAKIREWNTGKTVSETSRAKMRAAKLGKSLPESTRLKMSAVQRGKIISAETRAKRSAALKGRKLSPLSAEVKAKMSAANKGKKRSDETRARISAAAKKREADRRARKAMETM